MWEGGNNGSLWWCDVELSSVEFSKLEGSS